MSVQCSFFALLVWVPIVTNFATENITPIQKIINEIEVTTTTKSNAIKPEHECFDLYGKKKCEELRDVWQFCDFANTNLMDEMCKKTCGLCKLEIDCTTSEYKCCEDGITAKKDIHGSNCPGCKDKHSELCKKYEKDCNEIGWAGLWMQANCRKTCQYCKDEKKLPANSCLDDKTNAQYCPSWKQLGMCDIHASLMREHCPKTCGFCDLKEYREPKDQDPIDRKSTLPGH